MAHSHSAGCGCADELGAAEPFSLFKFIEVEGVRALNSEGDAQGVFLPHEKRLEGRDCPLRSEDDETMIVRVPFTGEVKLKRIIIGCEGAMRPTRVKLFCTNTQEVDFSNVEDVQATQVIQVGQDEKAEKPLLVNAAKFSKTRVLTLYFDENEGDEEQTELFYIGLEGTYTERKRKAVHVNYEKVANPQDHKQDALHEQGAFHQI